MTGLTRGAIERALIEQGVPPAKARWQADHECGLQPIVSQRVTQKAVSRAADADRGAVTIERRGLAFMMRIDLAPRTKKNGRKGGFGGIKQGPAYRAFRDAVIAGVAPLKQRAALPLPERPYNIAVTYYVDSHGKLADKCGLDQGLYDALENAGVVTNDWFFRTDDGTRIVAGDPHPRVELVITPIEEVQDGGQ